MLLRVIRRGVLACIAAVVLGGCSGSPSAELPATPTPTPTSTPTPAVLTVTGTLTVNSSFVAEDYDGDGTFECTRLPAGYEDLKGGAQVKVTDAAGTVVALGQLGDGTANDTDPTEDEPYGPTRDRVHVPTAGGEWSSDRRHLWCRGLPPRRRPVPPCRPGRADCSDTWIA